MTSGSVFIGYVEFTSTALASPRPQLLPSLDQLLDGLGRRNPLALHPTFFPGSVIEIANSVFAKPSQVLPQLLKLFGQDTIFAFCSPPSESIGRGSSRPVGHWKRIKSHPFLDHSTRPDVSVVDEASFKIVVSG